MCFSFFLFFFLLCHSRSTSLSSDTRSKVKLSQKQPSCLLEVKVASCSMTGLWAPSPRLSVTLVAWNPFWLCDFTRKLKATKYHNARSGPLTQKPADLTFILVLFLDKQGQKKTTTLFSAHLHKSNAAWRARFQRSAFFLWYFNQAAECSKVTRINPLAYPGGLASSWVGDSNL